MNKKIVLVYISGSYRANTIGKMKINIEDAWRRGLEVLNWSNESNDTIFYPVIPHKCSEFMDGVIPDDNFLAATLELMKRCDAVALVDNYESSAGVKEEITIAKKLSMRIYYPYQRLLQQEL